MKKKQTNIEQQAYELWQHYLDTTHLETELPHPNEKKFWKTYQKLIRASVAQKQIHKPAQIVVKTPPPRSTIPASVTNPALIRNTGIGVKVKIGFSIFAALFMFAFLSLPILAGKAGNDYGYAFKILGMGTSGFAVLMYGLLSVVERYH